MDHYCHIIQSHQWSRCITIIKAYFNHNNNGIKKCETRLKHLYRGILQFQPLQ